jgi:beta-lactamase class A
MNIFHAQLRTVLVVVGLIVAGLLGAGLLKHSLGMPAVASVRFEEAAPSPMQKNYDSPLSERLSTLSRRAGGEIGVAVIHVETDNSVAIDGTKQLPLYSVFKLPVAIAVLKEVEQNRLSLHQKLRITSAEATPGWRANTNLWRKPVVLTIEQLLELSIVRSDNTSTDKLLNLIGGPAVVTRRMRDLGLENIEIVTSVHELGSRPEKMNTGSAEDLARLLVKLEKGEVLQPGGFQLLRGFMERTQTGAKRLRGDLPRGTVVADKTGTGDAGVVTNDVGVITLPEGKGHIAIAVLLSGSKLSLEEQEKLIAEIARLAYDSHIENQPN